MVAQVGLQLSDYSGGASVPLAAFFAGVRAVPSPKLIGVIVARSRGDGFSRRSSASVLPSALRAGEDLRFDDRGWARAAKFRQFLRRCQAARSVFLVVLALRRFLFAGLSGIVCSCPLAKEAVDKFARARDNLDTRPRACGNRLTRRTGEAW